LLFNNKDKQIIFKFNHLVQFLLCNRLKYKLIFFKHLKINFWKIIILYLGEFLKHEKNFFKIILNKLYLMEILYRITSDF